MCPLPVVLAAPLIAAVKTAVAYTAGGMAAAATGAALGEVVADARQASQAAPAAKPSTCQPCAEAGAATRSREEVSKELTSVQGKLLDLKEKIKSKSEEADKIRNKIRILEEANEKAGKPEYDKKMKELSELYPGSVRPEDRDEKIDGRDEAIEKFKKELREKTEQENALTKESREKTGQENALKNELEQARNEARNRSEGSSDRAEQASSSMEPTLIRPKAINTPKSDGLHNPDKAAIWKRPDGFGKGQ
jgi:hypothetical protein